MSKRFTEVVPQRVIEGDSDEDHMIEVEFDWTPGTPATGFSGPPENYDPGSDDEFEIVGAAYKLEGDVCVPLGLAPHEEEAVVDYLYENWERPAEEPDPDWLRDQARDDRLLEEAEASGKFDHTEGE